METISTTPACESAFRLLTINQERERHCLDVETLPDSICTDRNRVGHVRGLHEWPDYGWTLAEHVNADQPKTLPTVFLIELDVPGDLQPASTTMHGPEVNKHNLPCVSGEVNLPPVDCIDPTFCTSRTRFPGNLAGGLAALLTCLDNYSDRSVQSCPHNIRLQVQREYSCFSCVFNRVSCCNPLYTASFRVFPKKRGTLSSGHLSF